MFEVCGVPKDKFREICSAVDKLDKEKWETVREEMVTTKGLDPAVADRIKGYVTMKPGPTLYDELLKDEKLMGNASAKKGIEDMGKMLAYCRLMGVAEKNMSFNLSLARGLDYYTGVIYEAVLIGARVGSVAGGGRYDNLVGMFKMAAMSAKKRKKKKVKVVPCVGVSIGIERLFAVVEAQQKKKKKKGITTSGAFRTYPTEVLVMSGNSKSEELMLERMKLCRQLWEADVCAEMEYKQKNVMKKSFALCAEKGIPIVAIMGENELARGVVQVKLQVDIPGVGSASFQKEYARSQVARAIRGMMTKLQASLDAAPAATAPDASTGTAAAAAAAPPAAPMAS